MMVDPGTASADMIKLLGLPSTKSKFCANVGLKKTLEMQKSAGLPEAFPNGPNPGIPAYCANSRILQVAGLFSAASLVVSSQMI